MADKKLTLTFDHGPTPGVTERVLDLLRDRDLHATFFPTGSHLAEPGVRALAERVLAEGHWLGNHTMTHGAPLGKRNDPAVEVGERLHRPAVLPIGGHEPIDVPLPKAESGLDLGELRPLLVRQATTSLLQRRHYTG